jgi:hypothetical protein
MQPPAVHADPAGQHHASQVKPPPPHAGIMGGGSHWPFAAQLDPSGQQRRRAPSSKRHIARVPAMTGSRAIS